MSTNPERLTTSIKDATYGPPEFEVLQTADRDEPLSSDELCLLGLLKETFGAQVTGYGPIEQLLAGQQTDPDPEPEPRPTRKCVICGVEYLGGVESEFCSNECARRHSTSRNPSRGMIRYLGNVFAMPRKLLRKS
jgi:hypothetical protein